MTKQGLERQRKLTKGDKLKNRIPDWTDRHWRKGKRNRNGGHSERDTGIRWENLRISYTICCMMEVISMEQWGRI